MSEFLKKPPLVIAHRGLSSSFPENTFTSIAAAFYIGVPMVEIDICLSKDKKMVVIHDDTLDRTTNGRGFVSEHTADELKKLEASSWFNEKLKKEPIPFLDEVLKALPKNGKLLIEVKTDEHTLKYIAPILSSLIANSNKSESCIIQSFDYKILQKIKALSPNLETHLLIEDADILPTIKGMNEFSSLNIDYTMVSKTLVDKIHGIGKKVMVWTVNEEEEMENMLELEVDGIITDYPDLLLELIENNRDVSEK